MNRDNEREEGCAMGGREMHAVSGETEQQGSASEVTSESPVPAVAVPDHAVSDERLLELWRLHAIGSCVCKPHGDTTACEVERIILELLSARSKIASLRAAEARADDDLMRVAVKFQRGWDRCPMCDTFPTRLGGTLQHADGCFVGRLAGHMKAAWLEEEGGSDAPEVKG